MPIIIPSPIGLPIMPTPQISQEYAIANNTLSKTQIADTSRLGQIEIGDSKQPSFFPQFKTMHWDNECNFSARLVDDLTGTVSYQGNKIVYSKPDLVANFYTQTGDEDGQFEFEIILKQKPSSNIIQFTIQSKGFDFFFQPPLTSDEITEGANRPDNVVGSYAVYHSTKTNNLVGGKAYRTGKAFHIYRPQLTDAKGNQVWADLNIDSLNGLMTITIPQSFLDSAVYPVTVDPTFGYTTHGGTALAYQTNGNVMFCSIVGSYVASTGDTITNYSVWGKNFDSNNGNLAFAAYSVVSGVVTNQLANKIDIATNSTTDQLWTSTNFSQSPVAGTQYGVAISWEDTGAMAFSIDYDAGSNPGRFNSTLTSMGGAGSGFSPTGTDSGRHYSMYATYTASGGTVIPFLPLIGAGT